MLQKRFDQESEEIAESSPSLGAFETARSASAGKPDEKTDDEKLSIFWRVFGGTILSIVALVAITIFNNVSSAIGDLRSELNREREARAALAKKDDVDSRLKTQYERIRAVEGYKADIEAVKERVAGTALAAESVKKDVGGSLDALKKDTAGLEVLKERVIGLEAIKKDVAGIDAMKEKLAGVSADLKAARDDVRKLQQEIEKNRASDLERKSFRDAQAKQNDETLKELQKGLQACREKIARLEGAQLVGPPERPTAAPKPKPGDE